MISITRLNNHPFVVNSEMIKFIEQAPDTVITLMSGEKLIVLETPDQLIDRIVEYRRRLLDGLHLQGFSTVPAVVVAQNSGVEET